MGGSQCIAIIPITPIHTYPHSHPKNTHRLTNREGGGEKARVPSKQAMDAGAAGANAGADAAGAAAGAEEAMATASSSFGVSTVQVGWDGLVD